MDNTMDVTLNRYSGGPAFFPNAGNFSIGTQHINVISGSREIPELQPIPGASHHRNRRVSPPDSKCCPGTRQQITHKVLQWAMEEQDDAERQYLYWLYGPVGCGKSAIAQLVAEELERSNQLAASFFFFRGSGERSRISRFAVTLAQQMSETIPTTASFIQRSMKSMLGLRTTHLSLAVQFEKLIYKPLQAAIDGGLEANHPFVIVVDGLDECEDRADVSDFLDHALEYLDEHRGLPLRFLVFSRIEENIHSRLGTTESVHIEDLSDYPADSDIYSFLKTWFSQVSRRSRVIQSYISHNGSWPPESDLLSLARHIKGSFIFASTLAKFILENANDGLTPIERFPLALQMSPGLDGLYTETLKRSEHIPFFLDIITTLALLQEPLSISGLAVLLDLPSFKITNVLVNLQSIIQVPGNDRIPVTFFHISLRDFLTSQIRAGSLHASPLYHEYLACRCLILLCGNLHPLSEFCMGYVHRAYRYHWESFIDAYRQATPKEGVGNIVTRTGVLKRFIPHYTQHHPMGECNARALHVLLHSKAAPEVLSSLIWHRQRLSNSSRNIPDEYLLSLINSTNVLQIHPHLDIGAIMAPILERLPPSDLPTRLPYWDLVTEFLYLLSRPMTRQIQPLLGHLFWHWPHYLAMVLQRYPHITIQDLDENNVVLPSRAHQKFDELSDGSPFPGDCGAEYLRSTVKEAVDFVKAKFSGTIFDDPLPNSSTGFSKSPAISILGLLQGYRFLISEIALTTGPQAYMGYIRSNSDGYTTWEVRLTLRESASQAGLGMARLRRRLKPRPSDWDDFFEAESVSSTDSVSDTDSPLPSGWDDFFDIVSDTDAVSNSDLAVQHSECISSF
ncbi:hypothetical protein DFP72DRAFT_1020250 [Ephemerocybe angulata]|uniref:Nephrocystin 3-like N-terminal domain-containing protein n=1 Tax=Ephemerocybe angulata TaxID=980116 RepID=A0A8H6HBQ0_9AGAR|nr:hypothetical protein DFP72DRAFT_1020250 [Tulosesus angulatus]